MCGKDLLLVIEGAVRVLAPLSIPEDKLTVLRCQHRVGVVVVSCKHGGDREAILRFKLEAVVEELIFDSLEDVHAGLGKEDLRPKKGIAQGHNRHKDSAESPADRFQ